MSNLLDKRQNKISVIIPTLNEADVLSDTIEIVRKSKEVEVIVVDGGSKDNTLSIANDVADHVIATFSSRGGQMDLGAERAKGDILLFLHADTRLPESWNSIILLAMQSDKIGGAFRLSIDLSERFLDLVSFVANLRSRFLGITYGDQAIFVKRDHFFSVGGYKGLPIFEDIDLWRRLKKSGKMIILKEAIYTSPRRWKKSGGAKNTLRNWLFILLYYLGISPERLYGFYYNNDVS